MAREQRLDVLIKTVDSYFLFTPQKHRLSFDSPGSEGRKVDRNALHRRLASIVKLR